MRTAADLKIYTAKALPKSRSLRALGTTAVVAVLDPDALDDATRILRDELDAIDAACSRFRPDSEISRLQRVGGSHKEVSPLLFEAMRVGLEVAQYTDGAVDPTVGRAVEALGYDRDFAEVLLDESPLRGIPRHVSGWWMVELDAKHRTVSIPRGIHIDLGATAKALVTDMAANRIAAETQSGVLVSVGGDVAVAGAAPEGGWAIGIAVDSSCATTMVDQVVSMTAGGLASSSTAVRTWRRGGSELHHIVDPISGRSCEPYWMLVSATGPTCVDANAASTASIVWGPKALRRLEGLGHAARLMRHDGFVFTVNGWPEDTLAEKKLLGAVR